LLVAKDNELKITEEKYNNEITSLMQKFQDDRNGYAAQLQAAHDEDIRKNQNEWDQKFNEVQNELKELRQSHDRQKEIISQQDKTLKDKSIAISVLQSSHDKELLEKDGLWADKMNALLKNSADDVQTFRTQLQNLRDRSVKDQEQIRSYQAQVASLQASLESATVLSVANAKLVSNSDDKQNGVCSIGVDALREYIMCALCQQPMLDAVVCRYVVFDMFIAG
jgi:chromosome segregation ATPase